MLARVGSPVGGDGANVSEVKSVAVLGTGIMGGAIARNLAAAGLDARAWNRTREKAEPLERDGVGVADIPAEAVHEVDAVMTLLASEDVVREVMTGESAALSAM